MVMPISEDLSGEQHRVLILIVGLKEQAATINMEQALSATLLLVYLLALLIIIVQKLILLLAGLMEERLVLLPLALLLLVLLAVPVRQSGIDVVLEE